MELNARCDFGQKSPVYFLVGFLAIVAGGLAISYGGLRTPGTIGCSLLITCGLFFALIRGHGIRLILVLRELVSRRRRDR